MIFFTADTHFGSQRTLELSRRPFGSVNHMDNEIVDRWNRVVGEADTVYHLGDFGEPGNLQDLNGKVIFLPGNYDGIATVCRLTNFHGDQPAGDKFVTRIGPNTDVVFDGVSFRLIHEPDEALGVDNFFLFGHIHKLQLVKRNGLNVGMDCHNFTPLSADDVMFYYEAIEKHYDDNVFVDRLGSAK